MPFGFVASPLALFWGAWGFVGAGGLVVLWFAFSRWLLLGYARDAWGRTRGAQVTATVALASLAVAAMAWVAMLLALVFSLDLDNPAAGLEEF